jgi:hypothetical protein
MSERLTPGCALSFSALREPDAFESPTVGVGQSTAAVHAAADDDRSSEMSPVLPIEPLAAFFFHALVWGFVTPRFASPSLAEGVGHTATAFGSVAPPSRS